MTALITAVGIAGLLGAAPSYAANELITTNMSCQYSSGPSTQISRTLSSGDTLTFRLSQTGAFTTYQCEQALYMSTAAGSLASPGRTITSMSDTPLIISSWPTDVVFTAGTADTTFRFRATGGGLIDVTITAAVPPPSPVEVAAGPADILQQVAAPRSGSCADVDTSLLAQFAEVSGGWGSSWAQWVGDGAGGEVCTRSFRLSPGSQTWTMVS